MHIVGEAILFTLYQDVYSIVHTLQSGIHFSRINIYFFKRKLVNFKSGNLVLCVPL